jgi:hypothetical protein
MNLETIMSNQKFIKASALAALCAGTVMALPHARAAGQEGMVVVRDQQTGELRAPNAAEAAALLGKQGLQRQAAQQRVESVGPGGSRKVQLGKSALVYTVVTRDGDGKLAEQCVSGEQAAHDAMTHPTPAKEHDHETQ